MEIKLARCDRLGLYQSIEEQHSGNVFKAITCGLLEEAIWPSQQQLLQQLQQLQRHHAEQHHRQHHQQLSLDYQQLRRLRASDGTDTGNDSNEVDDGGGGDDYGAPVGSGGGDDYGAGDFSGGGGNDDDIPF